MVIRALCLVCCSLVCWATAAAAFSTRTLTDQRGRTVQLPTQVRRIIPLGGAARFVVYLQAFDRVVGVEAMENRQPPSSSRPYNLAIRSRAEQLPVVGEGRGKPVNLEAIIALRPDLLITADADRAQADLLSKATGIPVLALDYGGLGVLRPKQVKEALVLLGNALGKQQRAAELVAFWDAQEREISRRLKGAAALPVYIGAVSQRGFHGITSTDADYYPLKISGATNLAERLGKGGHLYIDKEQLLVWDPPVILVDAVGEELVRRDYMQHQAFYRRLSAVRTGRIYRTLPYNHYHTNLELALANSWYLAKLLHPQRFADIDPTRTTDEICRFFTGSDCYAGLMREFGGFGPISLAEGRPHAH